MPVQMPADQTHNCVEKLPNFRCSLLTRVLDMRNGTAPCRQHLVWLDVDSED